MRFQTIVALLFSTLALAAPVAVEQKRDAAPVAAPEAKPQGSYASYGDYPAPAAGYGDYPAAAAAAVPNPYGSYSDYGSYKAKKE